ncbi:unnamed protein product [Parascedosporium putredinis]|uniref:ABC transporter domain-containing protein n=1 Tax=Parascedosporium putredinis TaxID=1442378 RepID=A0A9P1M7R9_9PEZI|nr:unnamed protein product [Parascedosporium putredinis]CAI7992256.1 unnamed protein product [Parascedosporium putredinis]
MWWSRFVEAQTGTPLAVPFGLGGFKVSLERLAGNEYEDIETLNTVSSLAHHFDEDGQRRRKAAVRSAASVESGNAGNRTRAISDTETEIMPGGVSRDQSPTPVDKGADYDGGEVERRNSLVQSLARQYTRQSHYDVSGNPFTADEKSALNPASEHFKASAWAKSVVNMVTTAGHEFRSAGVAFQNLNVYGYGEATDYQRTGGSRRRIDILRSFDGVTISGETNGLFLDDGSYFNYQGMSAKEMHSHHRGEAIYTAEIDAHFPQLSVGDTLTFAAHARQPRQLPEGVTKTMFANHLRDVVMAMFGISHTINTRVGLDSANAIEFCKTLRLQTELFNNTACVSIYQAPQSAYDLFDKATVLYEGRQIFFGKATEARQYFVNLGFECPARATTPDFLTSMTSPQERIFAAAWKASAEYKALQADIESFKTEHEIDGADAQAFRANKKAQQAKGQRSKSPFTLSYIQQVNLCLWRGYRRLIGDPSLTVGALIGNFIMSLIIGSVFYNLDMTTASFFKRGALIFFACLMNAFASALEILTLYAQRPIVEKHSRYALYHPSAEAVASMLVDMPYKVANCIAFNVVLYFMTNLRREPGPMVPAAILILGLIIFTGFVIPIDYMLGWCRWINYIDPLAYAFESLMVNEFHNREFTCNEYVPPMIGGYADVGSANRVCTAIGSIAGSPLWRNLGILIGFTAFFLMTYMISAELVSEKKSKGEVLVFRRGYKPATFSDKKSDDVEANMAAVGPTTTRDADPTLAGHLQQQTSVFHWEDVCYDVKIKKETRRILDNVDGWVKPGTLTALMGVSGAGKTTLLDCLADRVSMGVITGSMLVDGHPRDNSFQRKTGYVQQQDLHLQTTTVREALNFSALLRQPAHVSREEKLAYVDQVIKLLDMEEYADAVVGVPGEGLNVEQRKRLTIGPTSGLDSQTSWAILDLLEKLTKSGQAVLCTIHQPSAMLFQRFDRLLFLQKGGKTVYFGEIGEYAKTMIQYFERHSGLKCPDSANPAEWMLEAWRESPEYKDVKGELNRLVEERGPIPTKEEDAGSYREFAASFPNQFREVSQRVFQQYWRTPSYIYSKISLCVLVALFIGLVFLNARNTIQGLQNQMFAIFNILTVFGQLVQQTMPHFVIQRDLYEVRERPSKVYSWKVFMLSQVLVELPYCVLLAALMFVCWYYPVGLQRNAVQADQVTERGALMFLYLLLFLLFTSTFTDFIIAGFETAEAGGNIANLLFSLCLIFCGVLANPDSMPRFWIFMYYLSPFTYLVSGMLSTAVANTDVVCADNEILHFAPFNNMSCIEYLGPFMKEAGGYLIDENSTTECQFCAISDTNVFLKATKVDYADRWRNFGIVWAYIIFNVVGALVMYWLVRVPKKGGLFGKKKQE